MSITVVNEWHFKKDANKNEAKAAARELVEYFNSDCDSVQLSLWIEDRSEPSHHFHITVFDDYGALMNIRESKGIKDFIDKFWPHIIRDETYKSPSCDVWLSSINNFEEIDLIK